MNGSILGVFSLIEVEPTVGAVAVKFKPRFDTLLMKTVSAGECFYALIYLIKYNLLSLKFSVQTEQWSLIIFGGFSLLDY